MVLSLKYSTLKSHSLTFLICPFGWFLSAELSCTHSSGYRAPLWRAVAEGGWRLQCLFLIFKLVCTYLENFYILLQWLPGPSFPGEWSLPICGQCCLPGHLESGCRSQLCQNALWSLQISSWAKDVVRNRQLLIFMKHAQQKYLSPRVPGPDHQFM